MPFFKKTPEEKKKITQKKVNTLNAPLSDITLVEDIDDNIAIMQQIFCDDDTFKTHEFVDGSGSGQRYAVLFCDGVVSGNSINEFILRPIALSERRLRGVEALDYVLQNLAAVNGAEKAGDMEKTVSAMTYGDCMLLADGTAEAVLLDVKSFPLRSISEPESEKILSGPRDGFSEGILFNLSMIRRRLRTNDLKIKFQTVGRRTGTSMCICYLDSLVNKKLLTELQHRLSKIDIDGVLDSNYLTEFIRDARPSPFRTVGSTERPDVVVGKLLEGRVALFVDGTPVVLTLPYIFIENFQSSEDYYLSPYYTSFARMLRVLGFFFTVAIPGFFVAMVAYHHEMLPPTLLLSLAAERRNAPLTAAVEAFVLLIVFDLLKETGVRMPANVGQALSVVGGLVIGSAAAEARLITAPMLIVIAFTGITNLLVPKLNAAIVVVRFALLGLAATLGMPGLVIGMLLLLVHMVNLRSFGIPQITFEASRSIWDLKDVFIRAQWPDMRTRPAYLTANRVRMKEDE